MSFARLINEAVANRGLYSRSGSVRGGCIAIHIEGGRIARVVDGQGFIHGERRRQYIQLITNCVAKHHVKNCVVAVNLGDIPMDGMFNFCRLNGDKSKFLLPNHRFTLDDVLVDDDGGRFETFDDERRFIQDKACATTKVPKVYTSVIPHRSKIPYFRYALTNTDVCDGYCYIGGVHGRADLDSKLADDLVRAGMAGGWLKPWTIHLGYKYLLYNDGNTLSDRMRILLCSDSIIIRKQSDYEEFYTHLLEDGVNYVSYSSEDDLRGIVERFEQDTAAVERMIAANRRFVSEVLAYDKILEYTAAVINGVC